MGSYPIFTNDGHGLFTGQAWMKMKEMVGRVYGKEEVEEEL
jgi:hypothetical protein